MSILKNMLLQLLPSESYGDRKEVTVRDNVGSMAELLREISTAVAVEVRSISVFDEDFEEWIEPTQDMSELTEGTSIRIDGIAAAGSKKQVTTRQQALTLSPSSRSTKGLFHTSPRSADRAPHASLIAELSGLKPSALRKRVLAAGFSEDEMEEAEDADDPQQAMIDLVVSRIPEPNAGGDDEQAVKRCALIAELSGLKPSALRKRKFAAGISSLQSLCFGLVVILGSKVPFGIAGVRAAGLSEDEIETAEDADDPRQAMIDLVVSKMPDAGSNSDDEQAAKRRALIAELSGLRPSALRRRALAAGASEADVEAAEDAADSREVMIDLVVGKELATDSKQDIATTPSAGPAQISTPSVPLLISSIATSLGSCLKLLDRHISGTPRMRRAEVAETAELVLEQLQEADTEGKLAASAAPVLQQAVSLLTRHASLSEGDATTMHDVDAACQLLESLLISEEEQMIGELTSAVSESIVPDILAEVVCPLLDGGRIQTVSRKQQSEAAERAEELFSLPPRQLQAAVGTLSAPQLRRLAQLMVAARARIDLGAPSGADFRIVEELMSCLIDAAAKPGLSKLPTDMVKPHHGGNAHLAAGEVSTAPAENGMHAMLSYQYAFCTPPVTFVLRLHRF